MRIRLRYFFYDIKTMWWGFRAGVQALWILFPAARKWCPYDWWCNYELFIYSLRKTRDHLARHQFYMGWEEDVADMDRLFALWEELDDKMYTPREEELWVEIHDHLKAKAQRWWD